MATPKAQSTKAFNQQMKAKQQAADIKFRKDNPKQWSRNRNLAVVTGAVAGVAETVPATVQAINVAKYNKRAEENIAKAKYAAMPKVSVGYFYTGGNTEANNAQLESALNSVDKIVTDWENKY